MSTLPTASPAEHNPRSIPSTRKREAPRNVDARHRCRCGHVRDSHRTKTPKLCDEPGCPCDGYLRGKQVCCGTCSHPAPMHSPDQGGICHAFGCRCEDWDPTEPAPAVPVGSPNPVREPSAPSFLTVATENGSVRIAFDPATGDQVRIKMPRRAPIEILLSRPEPSRREPFTRAHPALHSVAERPAASVEITGAENE